MKITKTLTITLLILAYLLYPFNAAAEFSIILNFDDGYRGVYDNAFPVMKQYDLPGVVFVITKELNNKKHLSVAKLKELKRSGWEIGSHTVCHYNLEKIIPEVRKHEINGSRKQLLKRGLINSSYASFCSPKGKWNKEIEEIVSTKYQIARGEDLWYFYNNQRKKIKFVKPQVVLKNTGIDTIQWWIKKAKDENKPLILVFHEIAEGGNLYYYPPDKFKRLIRIIKNYKIITFHQFYQSKINQTNNTDNLKNQ